MKNKIGKYKRSYEHRLLMSNSLRKGKSVEECFFNKVVFTIKCWNWKGSKINSGHGTFGLNGKTKLCHRFIYEIFNGKIKNRNEIHHICENPSCVNPGHLEQLTNIEHLFIGNGVGAINSRKTHCKRGHLLPIGKIRRCKECRKIIG